MIRWRWVVTGLGLLVAWQVGSFARDMNRAYTRISNRSQVLPSPYGDLEYLESGQGPPVLVIHGSGGGFDQGELLARAVLEPDFRWVAPSRFGYLRSSIPASATFEEQAHAYAHLVQHLGYDRVAVVALSHGGPSALLLAALHPERVSSLTLLSAGVASSGTEAQGSANAKGSALTTIYQHDWMYWAITRYFRGSFLKLLGATDDVITGLTPPQRQLTNEIVDFMNPVRPRANGVIFDNQAQLPNERIAAIRAPTLILHAKDDTLQLFHNAQYAQQKIPGANLVAFEKGGHLVVAVELQRVRELTKAHILSHHPLIDVTGEPKHGE